MSLQKPSTDEIFDLACKTNALFFALFNHPQFNKFQPKSSPPTLFHVIDFVRNTYLNYIVDLLPAEATSTCRALANPFTANTDPASDAFPEDPSVMESKNYPKMDAKAVEKYTDAVGRHMMIGMIIRDPKKQAMFGGAFDFGENVLDIAKM